MRFIIIGLILLIASTALADQHIPFVTSGVGWWSVVVVTDPLGGCPIVTIKDQAGNEVERHFLVSPGQTMVAIPEDVIGWVDVECEECMAIGVVGNDCGGVMVVEGVK